MDLRSQAGETSKTTEFDRWFDGKQFTSDWTTRAFGTWKDLLEPYRFAFFTLLEIGSYEGRSALFFLRFFPHATLTCIDHWTGEFLGAEERFDANVAPHASRLRKIKGRSPQELDKLQAAGETFDLIYVDGNHRRDSVMVDGLLAWRLLKPNGVLIFDDYKSRAGETPADRPQQAIDVFLAFYRDVTTLLHRDYQVIVRRNP